MSVLLLIMKLKKKEIMMIQFNYNQKIKFKNNYFLVSVNILLSFNCCYKLH